MDNFVNGNTNTYVQSINVTGAGSKSIHFYDLNYGTYVIKWYNNSDNQVDITNAHLDTSY